MSRYTTMSLESLISWKVHRPCGMQGSSILSRRPIFLARLALMARLRNISISENISLSEIILEPFGVEILELWGPSACSLLAMITRTSHLESSMNSKWLVDTSRDPRTGFYLNQWQCRQSLGIHFQSTAMRSNISTQYFSFNLINYLLLKVCK